MVDYKPLNEANAAYLCSYILPKAEKRTHENEFRKSTKPPLGHEYFENRALDHVIAGVAPQNSIFTFPGVVIDRGKLRGKPKHFSLSDSARDRFLRSFVRQWNELRPGQYIPEADYVHEHLDRRARVEVEEGRWRDMDIMRNVIDTGSYYAEGGPGVRVPRRLRTA